MKGIKAYESIGSYAFFMRKAECNDRVKRLVLHKDY